MYVSPWTQPYPSYAYLLATQTLPRIGRPCSTNIEEVFIFLSKWNEKSFDRMRWVTYINANRLYGVCTIDHFCRIYSTSSTFVVVPQVYKATRPFQLIFLPFLTLVLWGKMRFFLFFSLSLIPNRFSLLSLMWKEVHRCPQWKMYATDSCNYCCYCYSKWSERSCAKEERQRGSMKIEM